MGPPSGSEPCIFCEIVARRAPSYIVYEDSENLAFLDIFPFTRGHLLVVPKRHVDRLVDLAPAEYGSFLGAVVEACRRVERLTRDYNVGLNQGRLAGQIVFHLHFHVIPRYDDGNPFGQTPRTRLDDAHGAAIVHDLGGPPAR
ncbi:MAG TPA: HIT domain-containing protein [Thermoplasmata archaeon]|jgi:histidine triad (HIT) family protein|nr:HIT domain-containing protein [Thermoplasmata archaeon]